MFLRDCWYVVGFSGDLGGAPVARTVCGRPIVLFRTASGRAAALEDRCGHRAAPLSRGVCAGETIRCPYHGLEYDRDGRCTRVPSQEHIPDTLHVRAYPLVERDAVLWLWPGEPARADPRAIVSQAYHEDSAWAWNHGMLEVAAEQQLVVDNLLDLSHLQYVHQGTLGGNPEEDAAAELTVERHGNAVHVRRWLRNVTPSARNVLALGAVERVDRWQEFVFRPGVLQFHSGAAPANTGALDEGRREHATSIRHFHGITPATAASTLYFFSSAWNFRADDAEFGAKMTETTISTFLEDKALLEAQQLRLAQEPDRPLRTLRSDAGVVHARRIMAELLAAEAAATAS
jgi:vanillate O-demethylase monooxygenase subunit